MEMNKFKELTRNYRNGSFIRISYQSEVPVRASYKGVKVVKVTDTTSRFGVRYSHIAGVEPVGKPDYAHRIDDKLFEHNKSGEIYLQLAPLKENANARVRYMIDGAPATLEEVKELAIPSYFNRSGDRPAVIRVKLSNIITIGG